MRWSSRLSRASACTRASLRPHSPHPSRAKGEKGLQKAPIYVQGRQPGAHAHTGARSGACSALWRTTQRRVPAAQAHARLPNAGCPFMHTLQPDPGASTPPPPASSLSHPQVPCPARAPKKEFRRRCLGMSSQTLYVHPTTAPLGAPHFSASRGTEVGQGVCLSHG